MKEGFLNQAEGELSYRGYDLVRVLFESGATGVIESGIKVPLQGQLYQQSLVLI